MANLGSFGSVWQSFGEALGVSEETLGMPEEALGVSGRVVRPTDRPNLYILTPDQPLQRPHIMYYIISNIKYIISNIYIYIYILYMYNLYSAQF